MDKYEIVLKIGSGPHGVTFKVRNRMTGEESAMKCIPRGHFIKDDVERGILNLRVLQHPNIIEFKELVLDDTKLGIVMEYAAGGELFDKLLLAGAFEESKARKMFQQLIAGVSYIHSKQICYPNLNLENSLLTSNGDLKICDFGFSKPLLHSKAKSKFRTLSYLAPEVLSRQDYDGMLADVWCCGVILYAMLMSEYPPTNPNLEKISRPISGECKDLLSCIFVVNPAKRITIAKIKKHPWYLKNLPQHLREEIEEVICKNENSTFSSQMEDDVKQIIKEAKICPLKMETVEEAKTSTSAQKREDGFG